MLVQASKNLTNAIRLCIKSTTVPMFKMDNKKSKINDTASFLRSSPQAKLYLLKKLPNPELRDTSRFAQNTE